MAAALAGVSAASSRPASACSCAIVDASDGAWPGFTAGWVQGLGLPHSSAATSRLRAPGRSSQHSGPYTCRHTAPLMHIKAV